MSTLARDTHFPGPSPRISAVAPRLEMLDHWRMGGSATAIAAAGLLPFAVAWHMTYLVAIAASIVGAATLAICCHLVRAFQLARLTIYPEFAHLPDLARKRRQLGSPRNRRRLAEGLRHTALEAGKPNRFDPCPLLRDRVASVRPALLEIAATLEHDCTTPDPVCLALLGELLHNGCSPLYNPNVHATDLVTILKHVRAGLTPGPLVLKGVRDRSAQPQSAVRILGPDGLVAVAGDEDQWAELAPGALQLDGLGQSPDAARNLGRLPIGTGEECRSGIARLVLDRVEATVRAESRGDPGGRRVDNPAPPRESERAVKPPAR